MHAIIYKEFRQIVGSLGISCNKCLEVGAVPNASSLLAMGELEESDKVGVNLAPPTSFRDYSVLQCNANAMGIFQDGQFDLVLCNAMLEHDRFFWRTISEIRRVLRKGGAAIIGVPGFAKATDVEQINLPAPWPTDAMRDWQHCSLTFRYHAYPDDYYKFSVMAMREVFFEGYGGVTVKTIMIPPRIIGSGIKL